ncbi:MAG: hypothetical protein P4M08_05885 [Oligoflexia bacterium]|nr:hypothetical protein [Oligoflexia bacterium]
MELRDRRGFTIVEALITAALVGLAAPAVAYLAHLSAQQEIQATVTSKMEVIRRNFIADLQNNAAWVNTVADTSANPSMTCLTTPSSPCSASLPPTKFLLHDPTKAVFYDGTNTASGYTGTDGTYCQSFDASNGNDGCPISYNLTWQPVCSGSCPASPPLIHITGTVTYKPKSASRTVAFNIAKYSFQLYLSTSSGSNTFLVPAGTITNYNTNFDPSAAWGPATKWYMDSACDNYCGPGNGAGAPGLGLSGGFMVEINPTDATCTCVF